MVELVLINNSEFTTTFPKLRVEVSPLDHQIHLKRRRKNLKKSLLSFLNL